MAKFKIGDIVRRITCDNEAAHGAWVLKVGTVCKVIDVLYDGTICVEAGGVPKDAFHASSYFELVKESEVFEMFDMKKNPWYIKITKENFKSVQGWLRVHYGTDLKCDYGSNMVALTNTEGNGNICPNFVMWAAQPHEKALEIKLTYKIEVDKVEWPVVESEAQKKLRELEEQQRQLADEISKLRASL